MTTHTAVKSTPKIVATLPAGTQAEILNRVLASTVRLPHLLLPQLAHTYDMPLSALQALLNHHGYPDPDNLRDNPTDDVDDLAASIQANGLFQPIVARTNDTGQLVIVAGHRRYAALQRLRWTHVDVVVRAPMRTDEVLAAMLIENGQRRDLDPIEEARGLARLAALHHLKSPDLAKKVGRSQPFVSSRLALLDLTPEQQDELRSGSLGIVAATELARHQSGKTRTPRDKAVTVSYFGPTNTLASRVKARCHAKGHKARVAGGVGCGSCWEAVIRTDERRSLQDLNAHRTDCVTCGQTTTGGAA